MHPCWIVISIKLQSIFIETALRLGCSSVNLLHIFRTLFPKNTSGGLLTAVTSEPTTDDIHDILKYIPCIVWYTSCFVWNFSTEKLSKTQLRTKTIISRKNFRKLREASIWFWKKINTFHATDLFWYPLKTSENHRFWCFQGISKEISGMKWINVKNVFCR